MTSRCQTLSFLVGLGLCVILVSREVEVSAKSLLNNERKKLVVISYDGFRPDYLTQVDTPNIMSLKKTGIDVGYMTPVFPTKTFPNHFTMVTGLYPESHGIVDNSVFDPKYNRTISGYGSGDPEFWNYREDVVPIWILNERNGGVSGVQWPGGDQVYGNNELPTHYLSYNGSRPYEDRIDYIFEWLSDKEKPANLVFMYFEEPDSTGHEGGPNSEAIKSVMLRMDNVTGYFLNRLEKEGLRDEVNVILLSDHGMHEVKPENVINVALIGDNSLFWAYGSPVLNIIPSEGQVERVYEQFKKGSEKYNYTIFRKEEMTDLNYVNSRRIQTLIGLADPGYIFEIEPDENDTRDTVFGVHGYDNRMESMRTFFAASGPSFYKGYKHPSIRILDVFPLMCEILEINPSPNNGSLSAVGKFLIPEASAASRSKSFHSTLILLSTFRLLSKHILNI